MGRDKVRETIGSKTLLEQVISRSGPICKDVIVVTAGGRDIPTVRYPNLKVVSDVFPEKGPLGGIYTGLVTSNHFRNIVVACDMPFLNEALLRYMVKVSPGFDMVVPRVGNLVEPLHAVYSKRCKRPIDKMIKENNLSVNELIRRVKVRYIEAEEIDRFEPKHLSFFNINTRADMERARALAVEVAW